MKVTSRMISFPVVKWFLIVSSFDTVPAISSTLGDPIDHVGFEQSLPWMMPLQQQQHLSSVQRLLQEGSSTPLCNISAPEGSDYACILQTPEKVCEQYNTATGDLFTCTCDRFGKTDTQINCAYNQEQCSSDNSTCYMGTISQVLNIALVSRAVTSCTTYTASLNPVINATIPDTEMCIRIIPTEENGNYQSIQSCSVSYQIIGSSDPPTICNSCTICNTDSTTAETRSSDATTTTMNSTTGIEFNCCNAVPDLQQSCTLIDPITGITIPQIDVLPPDQTPGQCTSSAHFINGGNHFVVVLVLPVVVVAAGMVGWVF